MGKDTQDGGEEPAGHERAPDPGQADHGIFPRGENDPYSILAREGNPGEFDSELEEGAVVGPDDLSNIDVPPGLLRRLFADPAHAPELLAASAVEQFAARAERDVRLLRQRNPHATDRQLAIYFKQKYSRAARWEGAGTGVGGLIGIPPDLILLAWIQNRLVLSIAAAYGHDMDDHNERAVELLIIQGFHVTQEAARKALIKATQEAVTRLVLRHLRMNALVLTKQMFKIVGIKFTRKAFIEKGVPLVAVPISAGVNEASTRLLANSAIKFYDLEIS